MKKLMLMVAMTMMAVAVMAVGKPVWEKAKYTEIVGKMMVAKDYVACGVYIDQFDYTELDKNVYLTMLNEIDRYVKKPKTVEEVKVIIAVNAVKAGITDADMLMASTYAFACKTPDKQGAYDMYKQIVKPTVSQIQLQTNLCLFLKKNNEAMALALISGNYRLSAQVAFEMKDKDKTFEYSRKAILDSGFVTAKELTQLLDRVNSFDYADSSVTPKMLLDLAVATNKKYSNFLVKDKATWEPVITGLRTTIEEMKK